MIRFIPLLLLVVMLWSAPLLTIYDPTDTQPTEQYLPPSSLHPAGTDHLGRDVFSRALYGGQRTLLIGISAAVVAVIGGVLLAIPAVFQNRVSDSAIEIVLDALLAFPSLILALVIMTILGRGTSSLIIATGFAQIPYFARVVLTLIRSVLIEEYVLAARSQGAGYGWILRVHVWRTIQPTFFAYAAIILSYTLINSAALSLLGLSADPSQPDWGVMLLDGRTGFRTAPWAVIAPGLALTTTIFAVQNLAASSRS